MKPSSSGPAILLPRFIRLRDAPFYLGMDRNRFNAEVRPLLTEIPIGRQGIAFDRLELDAWAENQKSRNGRPGRPQGERLWDAKRRRGSSSVARTGTSTSVSVGGEFARALERLFRALPAHLAEMALFAVNTGCRDREICRLRWDWEVSVPELGTSVFIVPGQLVKNGEDRLIVLNRVARSVVESVRGRHPEYVFSFRGKPVTRMLNTAWMRARRAAGLSGVRVHDMKHLRPAPARRRGELRGSSRSARPPFGSHHDPLLGGRALAAHRGGRPGVRASRRATRARGPAPAHRRIAHAELTQGTLQKSRKES